MMTSDVFQLDGSRIFLTPLHLANIRTHFRWNNDRELHALEYDHAFLPESFGAFARRFEALRHNDPARGFDFEVHRRGHAPSLIGVASLSDIGPDGHHACLAVTIGEHTARGQGYGREVVGALLRLGFGTLGLHRIMASALAYNTAWKRLLTTLGFQREACLREHVYRYERYWDKESYALLAREYHAQHARAA